MIIKRNHPGYYLRPKSVVMCLLELRDGKPLWHSTKRVPVEDRRARLRAGVIKKAPRLAEGLDSLCGYR